MICSFILCGYVPVFNFGWYSFYFVLEGVNIAWANFARDLLVQALVEHGLGGKIASRYDYFEYDDKTYEDI